MNYSNISANIQIYTYVQSWLPYFLSQQMKREGGDGFAIVLDSDIYAKMLLN